MAGTPVKGNDWSIFTELTREGSRRPGVKRLIPESYRRRVLRPYDEAGIASDEEVVRIRERLDAALDRLTIFEVERQLDPGRQQDLIEALRLKPKDRFALILLFNSAAFLHYVNTYLYFAIRFLPGTLGFRKIKLPECNSGIEKELPDCDDGKSNVFALLPPPPFWSSKGAKPVGIDLELPPPLEELEGKVDIALALRFLDTDSGSECPDEFDIFQWGEAKAFELWLRGLNPEAHETTLNRFRDIREGLTGWAVQRSEFYREKFGTTSGKSRPCKTEMLQVNDPAAARVALIDLYWIARLLRADVSSAAWVRYEKSNWLHLLQFNTLLTHPKAGQERTQGRGVAGIAERLAHASGREGKRQEEEKDQQKKFEELRKAEITLRSVFDLVLYMVQNSIEVTGAASESDRRKAEDILEDRPETTLSWRQAFDEELDEILAQRLVRNNQGSPPPGEAKESPKRSVDPRNDKKGAGWSKRLLGYDFPEERIGLALSGGGIRSATLNLGVLEGLMELDFLRHFDYLSTVSGGGFIGSWLVGNVRRSQHWLGRTNDWSESIRHLRAYSNYLSPRTGVLSADTWNLGNSWFRNTFLIQLTGIVWLFFLLLSAIVSMRVFMYAGGLQWGSRPPAFYIAIVGAAIFAVSVSFYLYSNTVEPDQPSGRLRNFLTFLIGSLGGVSLLFLRWTGYEGAKILASLTDEDHTGSKPKKIVAYFCFVRARFKSGQYVVRIGAVAAWVAACAIASIFWKNAGMYRREWPSLYNVRHYSQILGSAYYEWQLLLVCTFIGIALLSYFTLQRFRFILAVMIAAVCTAVFYLEMAGIFYFFRALSWMGDAANSVAFIAGPAMVLIACTVCILLLIGFTGRNALETRVVDPVRHMAGDRRHGHRFRQLRGVAGALDHAEAA